ncbi:AP-2 complex subunit alpha [Fulvia fulva]|uniref:AP-2 complex subunit alpha n=1 Tax=Passalora fulva TaxID=5499 RepID=A0A9Q8PC56_PASFU|nr:AP-2 complex subunit alpha [Fulvia fulva]UJO19791.1 AP-2 complex subunit alpha [Fulvia fulva]
MAAAAASSIFTRGIGSGGSKENTMRGLVSFIADLRNARARELEEKRINKELANIRQKFKGGNLTGYDKKKYVCKLLYIYILGWNVDFGHLEAVNLISANKYSEKQIGYLAVTLFLHEEHELLHLVVNSIRKDLADPNEINNCLALHAIANVGSKEMGEALCADVHRLLISPASKPFVKKKAALTLLRLYRKVPTIVQPEWSERIIAIMDDPDMGVALSVTSLVMTLAQDDPDSYKGSYVKAAQRLRKIVVDQEYSGDYVYYKVPCPWLQVKLLRLMQYFAPSEDSHIRQLMRDSLQVILDNAMESPKNVQQNNAQNAVLFEAINLIIHLDTERDLMVQISTKLGKFIGSRETNVRYLGLEAMTHLAVRAETMEPIKKHQDIIIGSLRDRDITVRRQGLDLLYSMCDSTNSQKIVHELLKYLQSADYAIREEMVLKIAILTEKYATDVKWYVDISMRLIAMAGDHVSDEVWQRIIQIVTNNDELQVYAAQNILQYCRADHCHETLVKIGSYILGEFGHLIADTKGCSPIEQFLALQAKFGSSPPNTRAMILSAFIKFVNLFPEIRPQLLQTFKTYSHSLDSELQQRACEYLAIATAPTDDLLRTICDEMPPFPERASALLSKLNKKGTAVGDKRTWGITAKDGLPSLERSTTLKRNFSAGATATLDANGFANGPATNGANDTHANGLPKTPIDELAGLDLTTGGAPNLASASHLSPEWEPGYNRLLLRPEGILYDDVQVQIGLRSEYRAEVGVVILYFMNKSSSPIQSFTTTLDNRSGDKLRIDIKNLPDTTVRPGDQTSQTIMFVPNGVFVDPPTIRVSYMAGALQALTLQLPVALHKYNEGAVLNSEDFFKRWKQIGGAPREAQKIFKAWDITTENTRRFLQGFKWVILDGVDPNAKNFVGATVLHTGTGKFGCLLRLEPNHENKMYRLTIRATDEAVPPVLMKFMEERLSQPFPN